LYRETWQESLTLPRSLQESFLEDSLVDLLAAELRDNPASSIEDTRNFVKHTLSKYVEVSMSLVASGALDRILTKLLIFQNGMPAPQEGSLSKLVKATKLSERTSSLLVQTYHIDREVRVYFVIPDIQAGDTLSKRSLELLLTLAHYGLGVSSDHLYVTVQKSLGTEFRMDSSIIKLLEDLISSAASPSGAYSGQVIKYGDYQCNLPTILASLHLLAMKQSFLRKRTPKKNEQVVVCNSSELRNLFNTRAGLGDKTSSYTTSVVKQLLQNISSVSNKRFPGGWIRSNRLMNNVKTDNGLIYKLGYTEKLPYNHKLQSIIFNDTVDGPDGRKKIRSKFNEKEYKTLSYIEFRLGTVLTCSRIDPSSEDSFDKQIKIEPMAVKSASALNCFNDSKYHKAIDTLNRAHALLVTVPKSTSKTSAIHYEIARNELLHISAKVPIKDHNGNSYEKISDLPKPVYDYCCKLYRFNKSKRDVSAMEIDETTKPSEEVLEAIGKKRKLFSAPGSSTTGVLGLPLEGSEPKKGPVAGPKKRS
jgi:hypothetical protein